MKYFIILLVLLSIFFPACRNNEKPAITDSPGETVVDTMPGECPYFTKDTKGNTILSWVRMINDSSTAFCYAAWDEQKGFTNKVVIPGSSNIQPHGENLPKIIFKPSGEIIALWGAANPNPNNKYSGIVFYVQSFDEGKSWSEPKPLVSDTASYDQRYYDVTLLPDGEAGIIWLDNRKSIAQEGSGLHFAKTHGEHGFMHDKLISQPCCQCCRTDLFVDSKGNMHALYRGIIRDSIRDMVHIVSSDQGKTFSAPTRISDDNWVINGCPHTGPAMTETQNGLQFAWFTGGKNKGCYYAESKDNGASFSPRQQISEYGSHPQLVSFENGETVIVWDEMVQKNNNHYKRIGLQKRRADGAVAAKNFITPDNAVCSYPVIAATKNNNTLVAYTRKQGERNFVYVVME